MASPIVSVLKVRDAGYDHHRAAMMFRTPFGSPERIRVAHHRDCKGIHELLGEDEQRDPKLWEVRAYERTAGGEYGWADYEPAGWPDLTWDEIHRRAEMAGR